MDNNPPQPTITYDQYIYSIQHLNPINYPNLDGSNQVDELDVSPPSVDPSHLNPNSLTPDIICKATTNESAVEEEYLTVDEMKKHRRCNKCINLILLISIIVLLLALGTTIVIIFC